jgi:hypothetical protein
MQISKLLLIVGVAALTGISSSAQQPKPLETLGLASLAPYREAVEGPGSRPNGLSLAFLDDRTIAVLAQFLFVPESGDPSARIQGTHINSVILTNAQNGTNQKSRVWKGSSGSEIHSTGTSGCPAIRGNELLSLSQTLEAVARRELPLNGTELNGHPQQNQWTIVTDPRTYPKHDQWTILTDPRTKKALLVRFPFEPQTTSQHSSVIRWSLTS